MFPKNRINHMVMIILLTITACFVCNAASEDVSFDVVRIGNIHSYADNTFQITSSHAGSLEIRIHDNLCVYRTIHEEIEAGKTVIHWDGCGYNREKLYEKKYTITASLTTQSGMILRKSFDSAVEYPAQCLQYVLPSDDILYLDHPEQWFLEYRTVTNGTVMIDLVSDSNTTSTISWSIPADGGRIARKTFREINGNKQLPPSGKYILYIHEYSRPEELYQYEIQIAESAPRPEPITETGEIMPDRMMTDDQIWELMMKPSVVIDIDSFKHQNIYAEPDTHSVSLGTVHGQSQGLKVIKIDNEWAFVGAWNHEEAAYVEGWVPLSVLKIEAPHGEYGLLIDKQKQTMTVFRNGKPLDTLLVSTGKAEKNSLYQETSAGCFLTGYHRVNFSMNGNKYDYVIQYDGGNLLHQTPYAWGEHKKDFTMGRAYLGAKASHACIRIQPEPGKGGVNAYWLFTHLPYHTRVVILDDQWERESAAAKLKRSNKEDVNLSVFTSSNGNENISDNQITLTFGGYIIPGGTRNFNNRQESFSSFLDSEGYGTPLSKLKQFFERDDLTCVSLRCPILKNPENLSAEKGMIIAPSGAEQIFADMSVDLIRIADEQFSDRQQYSQATAEALKPFADVMNSDGYSVYTIKGHRIGLTGCTESEYIKNPEIIEQRIGGLLNDGCEKTVMMIDWNDNRDSEHTIIQEAMARRSVYAGADLVIGNARRKVQGIDLIEGIPVLYSLGDLLDGSTSEKFRNQQGILIRAVFNLDQDGTDLTVIPIMPCGNSESKKNEYCPSFALSYAQSQMIIRYIWQDSTDAVLDTVRFYLPDQ